MREKGFSRLRFRFQRYKMNKSGLITVFIMVVIPWAYRKFLSRGVPRFIL